MAPTCTADRPESKAARPHSGSVARPGVTVVTLAELRARRHGTTMRTVKARSRCPIGAGFACGLLLLAACSSGRPALRTIAGDPADPWPGPGAPATVWVFVTTDCPIANGQAPAIEAIGRAYAGRGVRLFVVHVDPAATDEAVRAHAAAYGYTCPVLVDRDHTLVRHAGARVTPEAFVFDAAGALRYRGRIDDRYPALGTRRPEPTSHELRDALDAVLAGRAVAVPETAAEGCTIEALVLQ